MFLKNVYLCITEYPVIYRVLTCIVTMQQRGFHATRFLPGTLQSFRAIMRKDTLISSSYQVCVTETHAISSLLDDLCGALGALNHFRLLLASSELLSVSTWGFDAQAARPSAHYECVQHQVQKISCKFSGMVELRRHLTSVAVLF